jgi:flavin reductase (DIM6/NTAB) family NADH-FMN oxidoreductase RutF
MILQSKKERSFFRKGEERSQSKDYPMAIEKDFFRQVMGRFATGVTVVTTRHQGKLGGLTVNAFCSVSLNPPLVLICIDLASQSLSLIRESKVFAVNMLTDQQEYLSQCFATHSEARYAHFCHASYHSVSTGAPVIDDVLAFIDAHVIAEYPGGDHAIFLGQVVAMGIADHVVFADETNRAISMLPATSNNSTGHEQMPLLYYRAQYRHLAEDYRKASLATTRQLKENE